MLKLPAISLRLAYTHKACRRLAPVAHGSNSNKSSLFFFSRSRRKLCHPLVVWSIIILRFTMALKSQKLSGCGSLMICDMIIEKNTIGFYPIWEFWLQLLTWKQVRKGCPVFVLSIITKRKLIYFIYYKLVSSVKQRCISSGFYTRVRYILDSDSAAASNLLTAAERSVPP